MIWSIFNVSWDITAFDELPPYMRLYYQGLLSVYAEMEEEMVKHGQSYRIQYAKQEVRSKKSEPEINLVAVQIWCLLLVSNLKTRFIQHISVVFGFDDIEID